MAQGGGGLTPVQQQVVDELLGLGQPRPTFPRHLAADLEAELEAALAPHAPAPGQAPLWLAKRSLAMVHTCEGHYVAETAKAAAANGFEWTTATAEGEIAHRALEITVGLEGDPIPFDVVDRALDRVACDDGALGRFVRTLDPLDRAELRALAARRVTDFTENWPPLRPSWRPRAETSLRVELCAGQVVLTGRPDIALGVARGTEARVLLVDLKTGGQYRHQLDDLRFYALLLAVKTGVPPFRIATYYLDSARFWAEDVTTETLDAAVRRTIAGARALAALRAGAREATLTPGPACSWCSARQTCPAAPAG